MTCECRGCQRQKLEFLGIHTREELESRVFRKACGEMVGIPLSSFEYLTFVLLAPSALATPSLYQQFLVISFRRYIGLGLSHHFLLYEVVYQV